MQHLVPFLAALFLAAPALAQDAEAPKKPTKLTSAEKKQAKELIKSYFTGDDAAKAEALKGLAAIDHPSRADVSALAKQCWRYAFAGKRVDPKGNIKTCLHPDYAKGQYILQGGGKSKKKKGVFICLHGGGPGVGDGAQIRQVFGAPGGGGMLHVYPTVTEKTAAAWNTEREEQYVLAILDELKRSYRIDTNQVYLAGHSMGGYGTWSIGGRHADLFAALSPQAGGLFVTRGGSGPGVAPGVLLNLKNTPIWFYNSTDDPRVRPDSSIKAAEILEGYEKQYGKFDYVWKKYTDIGHGFPKEGLQPIWKWMTAKKRDPLPERVLWDPSRKYKNHFYWLRRGGSAGGPFDVARDRKTNTFTVTGTTSGLTIMVNKKMIDRKKEVVVKSADGKELWKGKVGYSLLALVESIDAKKDTEMWFDGWIRLGT